ncbi:MAG: hypothetical protein DVB26_03540 [Verrucomicrobia bacterium]|nr:MAG: hypothetical protein DVB26_03540 [Verrucomicrobiota bacterium]
MDSNKIKIIVLGVIATFVALYLGISAATAQFEAISWVLSSAVVIACFLLGRRIWLLIPFMGSLELSLRLPGLPTTQLLGQLLVLGFCLLLLMMRKLPFSLRLDELELWSLVIFMMIFQAYARNPVGLNIFGGESVGGRPYIVFVISFLVALLLCGLRVPPRELKAIVRVSILGGLINLGVNVLGAFVPTVAYWTCMGYINTSETNYEGSGVAIDTTEATRILWLPTITRNMALWLTSYISPLRACLHPVWGPLILFTILGAGLSGFRTAVMTVSFTFFVGLAYRGGFTSLLVAGMGGVGAIALLAIINLMHPLPPNLQRALSFLPGTWNKQYLRDAEGSTDWRVEIWKEALLTERWIHNKWLGDGLGFSAHELATQMNTRKDVRMGISGFEAHRETILANGDYHSTLVSGVRTSGYMGCIILFLGTMRLAIHAHRLIIRHRRNEYYVLCLFVGIPLVIAPLWLFLGASGFGQVASSLLLGIGMIRLLENNLPTPEYEAPVSAR